MSAKPFLKWAGGKRQLLPELVKRVPKTYRNYHELFIGGGALFFELAPKSGTAMLCDVNRRLIETYTGVRDHVEKVIAGLKCHARLHSKDYFLKLRDIEDFEACWDTAAWFIYLNRTCFNGLYRVNKSGRFNVPFGDYKNPTICDEENLRECSRVLRGQELWIGDFESYENVIKEGDFVYLDPPYIPASRSSDFTAYASGGFGMFDQRRLRNFALRLKKKGAFVMLSNSNTPNMWDLYSNGFCVEKVEARRNINSKTHMRGPVGEVIIT